MNLLIVGASARAAAYSALRAGMTPFAADFYSDRDLKAVATCMRLDLESKVSHPFESFPSCPWIYTGPLENHPDFLEVVCRKRTLWGIKGASLSHVRDPDQVSVALRFAGLKTPAHRDVQSGDVTADGTWLLKPLLSAGGIGTERLSSTSNRSGPHYAQQYIPGLSLSAVFIADRDTATLAGITRQLIGVPGGEFVYRGSIGPWPVAVDVMDELILAGNELAIRFGLVGLFGIDFILDEVNQIWPVEINPRYTASVEVLELSQNRSLLDLHRRACLGEPFDAAMVEPSRYIAKEVRFATQDGIFFDDDAQVAIDPWSVPEIADIPDSGTRYKRGEPVLTIFAESKTLEGCQRELERERNLWDF